MSILRYESNGIEFFTVQATGESGISHRGLAILCGISHWTINDLVKNLEAKKASKRLKAFIGRDLHLEGVYKKQGGEIKILRADFCAAVIKHYALEGREIAEHSMDKFMTLGVNTWIQSITGWKSSAKETITLEFPPSSCDRGELLNLDDVDVATLLKQLKSLRQDLDLALKHRHIIHNVVEKPVAVDLSLNRIVHTAIHEQAIKLNRAIATLEAVDRNFAVFSSTAGKIQQNIELSSSIHQMTNLVEQLRQENNSLKQVIHQQQVLISSSRKSVQQIPHKETRDLRQALQPRIKEITAILMKSQKRTGGNRAIDICTRKATIFARYEVGQSLSEIAASFEMPYETVKTYVKLTRAELKSHCSQYN